MPGSHISTGLGSEVMSRTEKQPSHLPAPYSLVRTTREVDAMRQILPIQSIGVLAESELSTSARLVAVMLMYHVNLKNGLCYPSISTLALECGCQPTTIKKALTELREFGFVEWETKLLPRTSTRVNHYNLLFANWSENDQWNDHTIDQSNDWPNDQPSDRSNIGHKLIKQIKQKELIHTVAPQASTGELSLFDMSSASPAVCDSSIGEKKSSSKKKAAGYSEDFERFWKAYPKRVNKGQAWKTWEKLRKAKELPAIEELCRAVRWRKIADDWEKDDGRFIPHPSTWLNAHGWEDESCQEPPDDPRNDPREEEAYKISNSMGGWAPRPEEYKNLRLYWERQIRINEALEAAGYGEFGTDKELIAQNLERLK